MQSYTILKSMFNLRQFIKNFIDSLLLLFRFDCIDYKVFIVLIENHSLFYQYLLLNCLNYII